MDSCILPVVANRGFSQKNYRMANSADTDETAHLSPHVVGNALRQFK